MIQSSSGQPEVRLRQEPVAPVAGMEYRRLRLEATTDFKKWSPAGDWPLDADPAFRLSVPNNGTFQFFRIQAEIDDTGIDPGGAAVFGYDRIFREELLRAGFLTPAEFAARLPAVGNYLSGLSFDPRAAKFWDLFNANPALVSAALPATSPDRRSFDFRMNPTELGLFLTNGFVVSERLGSTSFADVFYRIYNDDLPVFVSADAALHAWHFSYQRLLEEAEETQMAIGLRSILNGMVAQLKLTTQTAAVRSGPLQESLKDADYFLAVARSLLSGGPAATVLGGDAAVAETLAAVAQLKFVDDPPGFPMFGTRRTVDFSQFKIRGHYERSVELGQYFQAFMWTARTDLRGFQKDAREQSLRELGTAVVLAQLLQSSGQAAAWHQLDDLIRLFVGPPDAMTFVQMQPLLAAAGIASLEAIASSAPLIKLQRDIILGNLGEQLYQGDVYYSPFGPEQLQLPRSFAFTGQRFVADGWTLAQVVFDRIVWNEEIPGYTVFKKVLRRYPSALDVAYGTLGNRPSGWEIARRMQDIAARGNLRDGLPYAHNLTALAATFDRMELAAWTNNIYARWLSALRALSDPTTDARFPEAMRTRAWAMRTLNTQLASYTELKHDTVLYAKQPYTASFLCEYPAGFVEPVPEFWRRLKEMASSTADGLGRLPVSGSALINGQTQFGTSQFLVDLGVRHAARIAFCRNFAQQMATLERLAAKELQQQPYSQPEIDFIRGLMNRRDVPYTGPTYDGWYPGLFYRDYSQMTGNSYVNGSAKSDPLVTDIHTAPPDGVDAKGGVLHEATGNVDLLLISVDNGPDRMVYAGPVLSHYEFILPGPNLTRLADSEWQQRLSTPQIKPARPEWTRGYLVPK